MDQLIETLKSQHWGICSSCDALNNLCKDGITGGGRYSKMDEQKG